MSCMSVYTVCTDSDTDEETDRLLQKQYQRRDQYVEIPELDNEAGQQQAQVLTTLQSFSVKRGMVL